MQVSLCYIALIVPHKVAQSVHKNYIHMGYIFDTWTLIVICGEYESSLLL